MLTPIDFFRLLNWIDGRNLLETVEPYRRDIFTRAFERDEAAALRHSMVLCGRAKKNFKSCDLVLGALYAAFTFECPQGANALLLANDLDQAAQDLDLLKKLIGANPVLSEALEIKRDIIERRDARGSIEVLPAGDVKGSHGKTAAFVGFDEIHTYKDHSLLEALAPDPTREVLTWICSYDSLYHANGRPLWDLFQRGKAGTDPRMLFSWYAGNYSTDPDYQGEALTPEQRANPSMGSWRNASYLDEQRLRLPTIRYRRLHLNLGGQPEGAAFAAEKVEACVAKGRKALQRQEGYVYAAFVDMSGGSSDDAVLGIAHNQDGRVILDRVEPQSGRPPFDPRSAVRKFAGILREYGVATVCGDAYAGQTFRKDFEREGVAYRVVDKSASELYEDLEPRINSGGVELLDLADLTDQIIGLVWRGGRIDHPAGEHDDFANAAAGAVRAALKPRASGDLLIECHSGSSVEFCSFRGEQDNRLSQGEPVRSRSDGTLW